MIWQAMLQPTIDAEIMGFLLGVAASGFTFYFTTHKDQPAAICDTEDDPDNPKTVPKLFPGKTKTEIEQELLVGKGITPTPGWKADNSQPGSTTK